MKVAIVNLKDIDFASKGFTEIFAKMRDESRRESPEYKTKRYVTPVRMTHAHFDKLKRVAKARGVNVPDVLAELIDQLPEEPQT